MCVPRERERAPRGERLYRDRKADGNADRGRGDDDRVHA